jgi:lysophospholipase
VHHGDGCIDVRGTRLRYRTWESNAPRAGLVVVHGLAEHGGRYDGLGRSLAAHGVSVYGLDLRGHGRSDGQRGHVRTFARFLQDVDRFRREVIGLLEARTPLFLLGHSMGGLIALRFTEEYPDAFDGTIVVSPWLATAVPVPRWKANLANALARVAPTVPFRARINAGHLSRDPDVVRAYTEDPLVHDRITPRLFAEVGAAMGLAFRRGDRIRRPLLFLLAGADQLVDADRSLAFARSLTAPEVTIHVYPGYFHEVLNEPDGGLVRRDLRDWLDTHIARSTALT